MKMVRAILLLVIASFAFVACADPLTPINEAKTSDNWRIHVEGFRRSDIEGGFEISVEYVLTNVGNMSHAPPHNFLFGTLNNYLVRDGRGREYHPSSFSDGTSLFDANVDPGFTAEGEAKFNVSRDSTNVSFFFRGGSESPYVSFRLY